MVANIPNDVFQYSTYTAQARGFTTGLPRTVNLTSHGTFGLGVYEDGSLMLLLDSVAYTLHHGKASRAPMDARLSFTMVTTFQPTHELRPQILTLERVNEETSKAEEDGGRNSLMPFSLNATFAELEMDDGKSLRNVIGVIFGFIVPAWMENICGPRQFCHAVVRDLQGGGEGGVHGGRVKEFKTEAGASLGFAKCGRFHLGFPWGKEWEGMSLV